MKHSSRLMKYQPRLFKSLTPRQWYALTFITLCMLSMSWLFLYYLKVDARIDRYKYAMKTMQKQHRIFIKTKTETKNLTNLIRKLKNNIKSLSLNNKNQHKQCQQMTGIAQCAQKIGLSLNSCIAQKTKIKTWFSKQNVAYDVTGSSQQISQFISILARDHHLKCKQLTFKKEPANRAHLICTLQFLNFQYQRI